ncbi:amino acid adenylation domain-containing protein [Micromonospora sp. NPDC005413]|uniref:amino acid adenylation domain-containing protein n=1 Tax=Micromonospora sp. NPDC005413 TaxID=3154563 RepID=UPI0033B67969
MTDEQRTTTIAGRFAAQAARTPEAVAVVGEAGELTYAALDHRANRLARHLLSRGLQAEEPVALLQERSIDLVVSLLAVAKAGGTYLPVHGAFPPHRMAAVVADAGARFLLLDEANDPAPFDSAASVVRLADLNLDGEATDEPGTPVAPEQLAYVMYTSGSTGRPKGVAITQRAVVQLATDSCWRANSSTGAVLFHSPHAFDLSTYEIWVPLLNGGRVVVAPPGVLSADVLRTLITRFGLTAVSLTAGLFDALAETTPEVFAGLQEVSAGGDVVSPSAAGRVLDTCPETVVRHMYGPTEVTLIASQTALDRGRPATAPLPLGRPRDGMSVHVLDGSLAEVAPGEVGELYVAGPGLARGYLGLPGMTAERFLPCPFGPPGSRMYRTGDLVRRTTTDELLFVGRADGQIKVRGNRVEIGEIEAVMASHPGVSQVVVGARPDHSGSYNLIAYVVPVPRGEVSVRSLKEHVSGVLPDYMVPQEFVRMKHLPLTPNGKVDRRALPEPRRRASGSPRNAQEAALCDLFAELLHLPHVGVHDDFFALGGHSLLAVRLVARVRALLGVELAVRDLFEFPTVAGVVRRLGVVGAARAGVVAVPRPERVPLSFAQARLWFIGQLEGVSGTYNIPFAARVRGGLDVGALRLALADVVGRHESLRTVFQEVGGTPCQVVLSGWAPELVVRRVSAQGLAGAVREAAGAGFDLTVDPPLRAWLFEVGPAESVLVVVVHHIAGDGWSMGPLLGDLSRAYEARRGGVAPGWVPLPVQYVDYALWQRELLGVEGDPDSVFGRQLAFWRGALAGLPLELPLPVDRPRPVVSSGRGGSVEFRLVEGVHAALADFARVNKVSLFMVVQAGLAAVLTRLGAGTDVPIGTVVAGRDDAALEDLVGFFVNTLVLRTSTAGDPTFVELAARVRETDLTAFGHQEMPFERLVEMVNPPRSLARHPLFQVMLAWQGVGDVELRLDGVDCVVEDFDWYAAKFDLAMAFQESRDAFGRPAGVSGSVEYSLDLFDRDTAEHIAVVFTQFMAAVAADPGLRLSQVPMAQDDLVALTERTARHVPALPAAQPAATTRREARDPREEILCGLFAETLDLPHVGVHDDFFALGGHSLLAVRLVARVRALLGVELAVRDLFEFPTVAGVVRRLGVVGAARAGVVAVPRPERVPLSFAQARLWFIGQLEGVSGTYNIPFAARVRGGLDVGALRLALADVVGRHESLRTVFQEVGGTPCQVVLSGWAPELVVRRVSAQGLAGAVREAAGAGFDLTVDPPLRAWLFEVGPAESVLVVVVHHIAGDGWSMGPLLGDLSRAYEARRGGVAPGWVPLPVQYVDYALWQRELLGVEGDPDSVFGRQLAFWRGALAGLPLELPLPVDRPRPVVSSGRGGSVEFRLVEGVHAALADFARVNKVSLFMVVQAGLAAVLTRLGAGTDVPIGTVVAGRDDAALEDLVGFFVNTLVLRTSTAGDPTFVELAARVRETDLTAFGHQEMPFERLVEMVNPPRSLARHPLFQVMLAWQGVGDVELRLDGVDCVVEDFDWYAAKFDLAMAFQESRDAFGRPAGVSGSVEYSLDLFDRDTAEHIAVVFTQFMAAVAADPGLRLSQVPMAQDDLVALTERTARHVPALPAAQPAATTRREARDPREEILCGLFAETLDLPHVGVHDDFFALGGNSFSAMRLVARIRELGVPARVRAVFEAPRVADLAPLLLAPETSGGALLAPVIPLRAAGEATPLVLLPPVSGLSWGYASLLPYIPEDHPVYGVQATGWPAGDGWSLVAALVDRIEQACPAPAYHLAGWSVGGVVAHAVAAELADRGRVASLTLIDAYPFAEQRRVLGIAASDPAADVLAGFAASHPAVDGPAPVDGETLRASLADLWGLTPDEADQLVTSAVRYRAAADELEKAYLPGDVTLVTAGRDEAAAVFGPELWHPYVGGRVHRVTADGDHFGMLAPPAVATVGAALAAAVRADDRKADAPPSADDSTTKEALAWPAR